MAETKSNEIKLPPHIIAMNKFKQELANLCKFKSSGVPKNLWFIAKHYGDHVLSQYHYEGNIKEHCHDLMRRIQSAFEQYNKFAEPDQPRHHLIIDYDHLYTANVQNLVYEIQKEFGDNCQLINAHFVERSQLISKLFSKPEFDPKRDIFHLFSPHFYKWDKDQNLLHHRFNNMYHCDSVHQIWLSATDCIVVMGEQNGRYENEPESMYTNIYILYIIFLITAQQIDYNLCKSIYIYI